MVLKWIGELAVALSVLAIIPSLISGVGISMALSVLLLSGISALSGTIKYALITIAIVTFNLFVTSILAGELSRLSGTRLQTYILFIGTPYIVVFILIGIGFYVRKPRRSGRET